MDAKTENNNLENISKVLNKVRDYFILVFTYIVYKTTRSIVTAFQKFTWGVTGVEKTRRDARKGLNFKQSAHVQEIFWRRKIYNLEIADSSDFITFHKCFKPPSYVLQPNISLYCVSKEEAVFIEVDERCNVYDSRDYRSLYMSQFINAKRIITMPLASFHKIAQDLGSPKVPVIWLSGTGRCGSTLLSRVFAAVPGCMVLEDPDALTNLAFLNKLNQFPGGEYDQLLISAVRLLCKPDDRASMFVIRARPCCIVQIHKIYEFFPNICHVFAYRNSLKTVSSFMGVINESSALKILRTFVDNTLLATVFPCIRRFLYNRFCYVLERDSNQIKISDLTTFGIFTHSWALCLSRMSEATEKGIPILSILYEESIRNPRRTCSVLFERLRIRTQYLMSAVEAFKEDSRSEDFTTSFISNDSRRTLSTELLAEADGILKKYNLPKLGERFEMPGLLSIDPPFAKTSSRDILL
ncbi:hypothetical protein ACJMK2_023078 [Sinanodonta woodiana]|uniref:Sulfotransferase domain-containing protein n=1 Tax=Sinanodonta woodiana TaxID=1069815 RepID=A0ABD3T405_SINWO